MPDWAKKDITDFERSAQRFFKNTKAIIVIEPDIDGIHELHKFRFSKNLPSTLTRKTISACENLRSALDLLAVEVARPANVPSANIEEIHFPFTATSRDFKSRINGKSCAPLPGKIKEHFASYEPYGDGSELLWAINELANTSKHHSIVHASIRTGVALPYISSTELHLPIEIIEGVSDSPKNEIVFARTERGLKWKYRLQVAFGVSFGKIERIEGKEIFPNLIAMADAATTIVNETEQVCREIGLV